MKYVAAIVALWALAIIPTFLIVADRQALTILGPLHAVCMIGSVVVVRKAQLPHARPTA
jgi:hypothetical protein